LSFSGKVIDHRLHEPQWHGERQNHPDLSASIDNSHQQGVAMKDLGHCDVIGRMALPWHAGRLAGSGLGFFAGISVSPAPWSPVMNIPRSKNAYVDVDRNGGG
jgi:hypothetical protein